MSIGLTDRLESEKNMNFTAWPRRRAAMDRNTVLRQLSKLAGTVFLTIFIPLFQLPL